MERRIKTAEQQVVDAVLNNEVMQGLMSLYYKIIHADGHSDQREFSSLLRGKSPIPVVYEPREDEGPVIVHPSPWEEPYVWAGNRKFHFHTGEDRARVCPGILK